MAPRVLISVILATAITGVVVVFSVSLPPSSAKSILFVTLPVAGGLFVVLFSVFFVSRAPGIEFEPGTRIVDALSWFALGALADTGAIITGTMMSNQAMRWLAMLILPLVITPVVLLQVGRIVRARRRLGGAESAPARRAAP